MGNEDIYDIIMARIKELNQNDFEGILHLAAQKGWLQWSKWLYRLQVIKIQEMTLDVHFFITQLKEENMTFANWF